MPRPNRGPHTHWDKDKGQWLIRWFEAGKRRSRGTGIRDRGDAEGANRELRKFLALQGDGGRPGPRDPDSRRLADILADYAKEHGPAVAAPRQIAYALKALLPFWGAMSAGDVTEQTCRAYCEWRAKKSGTMRHELVLMRAAIYHDWKRGRLTRKVPVWLPQDSAPKERWLTRAEAAALLRAAKAEPKSRLHLPLFILIGLYTGARKEAILSLRWSQVDLARGLIDFNPPGRARTSKGRPVIRAPNRLLTFLRLARRRGHDLGHVISYEGRGLTQVTQSFRRACRDAKLQGVSPHTLRHTAASWMVQAGVSFQKVAAYLGHKDSRTTERVYAKWAPDYHDDAVAAFDRRRT